MGRLFGTDGVRGVANAELTPELAFKLGKSGAHVLSKDKARPVVLSERTHAFLEICWKTPSAQGSWR